VCICRECVECKHYKRGDLFEKNCNHVCRDEIVLVDELGNLYLQPIHNIMPSNHSSLY